MDKKLQIIGLSGTNGAGKDTVGEVLAERHNYLFISVTELLRDEVRRRGLPVEREHLRTVSAEWRREFGLGVLVDRAVDAWKETGDKYQGIVMASLRNPYEADRVHELDGSVIWVDADPKYGLCWFDKDLREPPVDVVEADGQLLEEVPAGFGELDPAMQSREQRLACQRLQLADLPADCCLRHEQFFRRAAEAQQAARGLEASECCQWQPSAFHCIT